MVRESLALLFGLPRPSNNMPVLAALAAIAPLVGLLGTVVGLVGIFSAAEDPSAIADGIGDALLTTQVGLMIAIPVLVARVLLLQMRERRQLSLECST